MPKKVRKKSAFTNKSAKKSAFTNKSAQKSTLKSTFGSSEPICCRMPDHTQGGRLLLVHHLPGSPLHPYQGGEVQRQSREQPWYVKESDHSVENI